MEVIVSVPVGFREKTESGGDEVMMTGREEDGASGVKEGVIVGSVALTPCVGAMMVGVMEAAPVGVVEAAPVGVVAVSVGVTTDPEGTAEPEGRTPLAMPEDGTSVADVGGVGISEASDPLVSGRFVSVVNGAVPVPTPEIPDTAEERMGASVGKAVMALDSTGTRVSVNDAIAVPVPTPEMPELTGAGVTAAVSVGVGRIDRGVERIVDNPTKRPV
jgi:hypothetical protein